MNLPTYYRIKDTEYVVRVDSENRAIEIEKEITTNCNLNFFKLVVCLILSLGVLLIDTSYAYSPIQSTIRNFSLIIPTKSGIEIVKQTTTTQKRVKSYQFKKSITITPNQETIDFWFGGKYLDKDLLSETISQVIDELNLTAPEKKNKARKFLLEIAAIESDMGLIVNQKRGPAQGIFQILPSTFDYLIPVLKKKHPELYQVVMSYYVKDKSRDWNRRHNVKLGAAFSLTYCYIVSNFKLDTKLGTIEQRAVFYKTKYNTNTHSYLIPRYLERAKKHEIS